MLAKQKKPKLKVGILGATGAVGQRFAQLLADHPWFEITALTASDRSTGKRYADACKWLLRGGMPPSLAEITLVLTEPGAIGSDVRLLFSALPGGSAGAVEEELAAAGFAVCSNASAHRMDADVPLLIPDVNPDHTALIRGQRARRGWPGFIVTNPNCTTTHLVCALKPLHDAFGLTAVNIVSMQAISGAGYPGVSALDILDNVIPFIGGEEEKVEIEPRKLLGALAGDAIALADFAISAQCTAWRCATATSRRFRSSSGGRRHATRSPTRSRAIAASRNVWAYPTAPDPAIILHTAEDRPQPRLDRLAGGGMATHVGRLRADPLFDYKFIVLGHNTIRGAARGAILNGELLVAQGYLGRDA